MLLFVKFITGMAIVLFACSCFALGANKKRTDLVALLLWMGIASWGLSILTGVNDK